jgi:hypothetical protein
MRSEWKRCIVIAAAVFMFVFLMAPGAEEADHHTTRPKSPSLRNEDPSQNGGTTTTIPAMESIPETVSVVSQEPPAATSRQGETKTISTDAPEKVTTEGEDAKKLEDAISTAMMDFDEAAEEELQANQSMLTQGVKKVEDLFKFGLGRLFGNTIDNDEMADIAKEVSDRLENEVQDDFRNKAFALADEKAEQIEEIAEADEEVRMDTKAIRGDVKQAEELEVAKLKDDIDAAAKVVADGLQEKALRIEKEIVNMHLAKKGVHVEVKDGELMKDGDDEPSEDAGKNALQEIKEEEQGVNTTVSVSQENEATEVVSQEDIKEGGNGTEAVLHEEAREGKNDTIEVAQVEVIVGENGTDEFSQNETKEGENETSEVSQEDVALLGENGADEVSQEEIKLSKNATDGSKSEGTEPDETKHEEEVAPAEEAIEKREEDAVIEDEEEEEVKAEAEAEAANQEMEETNAEEETEKA